MDETITKLKAEVGEEALMAGGTRASSDVESNELSVLLGLAILVFLSRIAPAHISGAHALRSTG